jgi:GntR family transcriptional regulator, transcriptional repressor for pyruvate dehydrogenase complex
MSETLRRPLVQETAADLRERVFAAEPETRIGSLPELAQALDVGIVTVQQAARILEHEGLLSVRRGPGGGYYGTRPDAAALERAIGAWMRMHPGSYAEALDITSLMFNELVPAAAACDDPALHAELAALAETLDDAEVAVFEPALQDLLFRMVDRPLLEVLTRVTLGFARGSGVHVLADPSTWRAGRRRIIAAILARDPALARFEADRSNRRAIVSR